MLSSEVKCLFSQLINFWQLRVAERTKGLTQSTKRNYWLPVPLPPGPNPSRWAWASIRLFILVSILTISPASLSTWRYREPSKSSKSRLAVFNMKNFVHSPIETAANIPQDKCIWEARFWSKKFKSCVCDPLHVVGGANPDLLRGVFLHSMTKTFLRDIFGFAIVSVTFALDKDVGAKYSMFLTFGNKA